MSIAEKLTTLAQNQQKVYDAGKQAEYDRFWDAYQQNGERTKYNYAFSEGWNNDTFRPKYPIRATDASYMFDGCGVTDFDFVERGVQLDLSAATTLTYMCRNAKGITRMGVLDTRMAGKITGLNRLFYGSSIQTIDEFIVDRETKYSNTFIYAGKLKKIRISGEIAQDGLSFADCRSLSRESVESVITALSADASGLTVGFNRASVNTAFETSEGAADGSTSAAWLTLVATKSNWTFTLT